jgi:hypothetical protein
MRVEREVMKRKGTREWMEGEMRGEERGREKRRREERQGAAPWPRSD